MNDTPASGTDWVIDRSTDPIVKTRKELFRAESLHARRGREFDRMFKEFSDIARKELESYMQRSVSRDANDHYDPTGTPYVFLRSGNRGPFITDELWGLFETVMQLHALAMYRNKKKKSLRGTLFDATNNTLTDEARHYITELGAQLLETIPQFGSSASGRKDALSLVGRYDPSWIREWLSGKKILEVLLSHVNEADAKAVAGAMPPSQRATIAVGYKVTLDAALKRIADNWGAIDKMNQEKWPRLDLKERKFNHVRRKIAMLQHNAARIWEEFMNKYLALSGENFENLLERTRCEFSPAELELMKSDVEKMRIVLAYEAANPDDALYSAAELFDLLGT